MEEEGGRRKRKKKSGVSAIFNVARSRHTARSLPGPLVFLLFFCSLEERGHAVPRGTLHPCYPPPFFLSFFLDLILIFFGFFLGGERELWHGRALGHGSTMPNPCFCVPSPFFLKQ